MEVRFVSTNLGPGESGVCAEPVSRQDRVSLSTEANMRFPRYSRRRLGIAFAAAFLVWLSLDFIRDKRSKPVTPQPVNSPVALDSVSAGFLAPAPDAPKPIRAELITRLKPGMTRTEVEDLVGTPAWHDTNPAIIERDRVMYHTTYEADLEPPSTVRPIQRSPSPPPPRGRGIAVRCDQTGPSAPRRPVS
jgi:hypothetical protein